MSRFKVLNRDAAANDIYETAVSPAHFKRAIRNNRFFLFFSAKNGIIPYLSSDFYLFFSHTVQK